MKLNESKNISLVGISQFGIRLYFSISQFDQDVATNADGSSRESTHMPPSIFQLVHVRIPPNIELSSQNRNGPVSSAYSSDGITLMMSKRDEQTDSVILLNRDLFLLHNNFKESKSLFDIDGRIWSVQEIKPSLASIKSCAMENDLLQTATSASGIENIPKLTAEYFDLPRRFAMITPQVKFLFSFIQDFYKDYLKNYKIKGCFLWNKLRPIDQLSLVLKEGNGPNSDGVRLFFNRIYEVKINFLI